MTPEPADESSELTRVDAQQRADRISAFTRELADLERAGVLRLEPGDRARLDAYHAGLLERLARRFDVDRSDRQRRMSLGMRIASLVGAVTLSAAGVFFFNRVWGLLSTPSQLGVLMAAPLVLLGSVEFAARREKTLYVASILAVVATAAFILDVSVVGAIFNMRPSPYAFALWAAFALIVAYRYGLRLLLAAGLALAMAFACALAASVAGLDLQVFPARPEPLLPLGAAAIAAASLAPNRRRAGFPETWRLTGSIALLVPLIFLSTWSGVFSYFHWPERVLGPVYDVAGFALGAAVVWLGIRRGWRETVQVATAFLVVFLFAKCFDWWWDWMPRYLFFLLLGGLAVAVLIVLGRVRSRQRRV
jgi:uncharacterized membrane protein